MGCQELIFVILVNEPCPWTFFYHHSIAITKYLCIHTYIPNTICMSLHDTLFFCYCIVVTIGFSETYHVLEDAGGISVTVLVLMNSLARDVVVTLYTLDDTTRGKFA